MKQQLKSMFPMLIEEWEKSQDASFPERQKMMNIIMDILQHFRVRKVLDLGTGSGSLSKKILESFPECNVIGIDFDQIMLDMATINLTPYQRRFLAKERNLLQMQWAQKLPEDFDTVVSALALHHIPDSRKKNIYRDVFDLLKPEGIFLCIDEVKSHVKPFDRRISEKLENARVKLVHETKAKDWISFWNWVGEKISAQDYALKLLEKTYPEGTDTKGSLADQLRYLTEAGFPNVECFYRNHAMVIYGAVK